MSYDIDTLQEEVEAALPAYLRCYATDTRVCRIADTLSDADVLASGRDLAWCVADEIETMFEGEE